MAKEDKNTNNSHPNRLESPNQLKDYVRVTSVSPLLIGCTILLLLGAFVAWGIFGTVTDHVEYSGLTIALSIRLTMDYQKRKALDNVTKQKVALHLSQMKCTRIMISQRPENLRYCDRIITIDQLPEVTEAIPCTTQTA